MVQRTAADRFSPFTHLEAYSVRDVVIACLSSFDEVVAIRPKPNFDAYYKRYHPELQKFLEQCQPLRAPYELYHSGLQELFEQFKLWLGSLGGAEGVGSRLTSRCRSRPILIGMVKVFLRKIADSMIFYITAPGCRMDNFARSLNDISLCIEGLDWIVKLIPKIQMPSGRAKGIFAPDKRQELGLYLEWLLNRDKVDASRMSDIQSLGPTDLVKNLDDPSNLPKTILEGLVPLLRVPEAELLSLARIVNGLRYGLGRVGSEKVKNEHHGLGCVRLDLPEGLQRLATQKYDTEVPPSLVCHVLSRQPHLPESILQELVPWLKYHDHIYYDRVWPFPVDVSSIFWNQMRLPEAILHEIAALIQTPAQKAKYFELECVGNQNFCLPDSPGDSLGVARNFKDKQLKARRIALGILCRQSCYSPGLPKAVLQKMLALLRDPDADTRIDAVSRMAPWPCLAKAMMQDMVALLKDPDTSVRIAAVLALDQQPRLSDTILQVVAELLKSRDLDDQLAALRFFTIRPGLPEAILQDMVALLKGPPDKRRKAAAIALGGRGDRPEAIVQALMATSLNDRESGYIRVAAIGALGRQRGLSNTMLRRLAKLQKLKCHWCRRPRGYHHANAVPLSCVSYAAARALEKQGYHPNIISSWGPGRWYLGWRR